MLSIRNLTHTYPNGVCALSNINLDIPKGMFGLLGPNGAGKSTLMRTIATLQQPSAGSIHFGTTDVLKEPERLRQVLGYLPQEFGVYPRGSAYEILEHIAVMKGFTSAGERREVVEGLLHQTNLYADRKKRLATFSGGMKQRFGIAQALIGDPKLVIVDEPTAGLDPEERNRFYNLLATIGEEVVVILSTHIVEDVAVLCSSMAIIARAKVVLQGRPADLLAPYDSRIWTKLIRQAELEQVQASVDVVSTHFKAGKMLIRVLADTSPGEGFEQVTPTLEDIYFTATRKATQSALPHAA
jgi:ABC-2 type transport system ATP-binding protein